MPVILWWLLPVGLALLARRGVVLTYVVVTSLNSTEAFGMVQVEAMLCGTPVVATDLPGVREAVRRTGMGRIVPTRDAAAVAAAFDLERSLREHEEVFEAARGTV